MRRIGLLHPRVAYAVANRNAQVDGELLHGELQDVRQGQAGPIESRHAR
jgi:hypothetical protein